MMPSFFTFVKTIIINRALFSSHIRNVGIIAHIDAGKTTCTERMLLYSGFLSKPGDIDRGNTVMDFMEQERERGITIGAAAITFPWGSQFQINLMDTPGHVDFGIEVERVMRVIDGVVCLIDGSAGVEAQTMAVWDQASRYKLPALVFINKMDKVGACFETSVREVHELLLKEQSVKALILQRPVLDHEEQLVAVDDFLTGHRWIFEGDFGKIMRQNKELIVEKGLNDLREQVASLDDQYLESYVTAQSVRDAPELLNAIARLTRSRKIVPIFCGSALRNVGIQLLMNGICDFLPAPSGSGMVSRIDSIIRAMAFKVTVDAQRGVLVYVRVYEGSIKTKQILTNANRGTLERVQKIYRILANEYKEVSMLELGDVGILVGLKNTATGETLVNQGCTMIKPMPGIVLPPPVFSQALSLDKGASKNDQEELEKLINLLCLEDPSVYVSKDEQTGQTILKGQGELHLEIVLNRLLKDWKCRARPGALQIAFQETLIANRGDLVIRDQIQRELTPGQHCAVSIEMEISSLAWTNDLIVPHDIDVQIPEDLSTALKDSINASIEVACKQGPLKGFPLRAIQVRLLNVFFPNEQTESQNIEVAKFAVRTLLKRVFKENEQAFVLVEPVMKLFISTPTEYTGSIQTDLNCVRQAIIHGMSSSSRNASSSMSLVQIEAEAPLANLLGYASKLRSLSSGLASFQMNQLGYKVVQQSTKYDKRNEFDDLKEANEREQVQGPRRKLLNKSCK